MSKTRHQKKWQSDTLIKFLELYEQSESLWNRSSPYYKCKEVREMELVSLVEAMQAYIPGLDVNQARAKLRSVRNAYTLEVHKVHKSSGEYRPTVPWFKTADRFLRDVVEIKDVSENGDDSQDIFSDKQNRVSKSSNSCQSFWNSKVLGDDIDNSSKSSSRKSRITRPTIEVLQACGPPSKRLKVDQKLISENSQSYPPSGSSLDSRTSYKEDEFDIFGKVIAGHLRKLPVQVALECQSTITTYVINRRLSAYNCDVSCEVEVISSDISQEDETGVSEHS